MGKREENKTNWNNLIIFAILLFLAIWVFRGIISGQTAPFGMSFKSDHPWADVISQEEHARVESFIRDPILQTWPFIHYAHESIRNGDFPLWNTDQFSGTPFIANRSTGLLNPLILIPVAIFEPVTAMSVIYFVHFFIAGIFFFLFLKEMKLKSPVAMIGAIAYMLQGAYIPWGGISACDRAYFPMVMYFLERALGRKDKIGIIGFIFSFYLLSVTGYPQFVVYSIYLILAWILFSRGVLLRKSWKSLLAIAILFGIALLIGAMQNLPTLEFYMQSPRASTEYQQALASANALEVMDSPVTILRYYFPKMWGDYISEQECYFPEMIVKTYIHGYVGIIAAFTALFFAMVYRNRYARFFSVLFLLGWLFIAWNQLFIIIAGILPGLRISSIKPHFLTNTAIIITACFVINQMSERLKSDEKLLFKLRRINLWALSGLLGLFISTAYVFYEFTKGTFTAWDVKWMFQLFTGVIFITLGTSILLLYARRKISASWLFVLLTVLTLIDLVPYNSHIMIQVPKDRAIFTTPGIEFLQEKMEEDGPFRIFRDRTGRMLPANSTTLFGLDDMGGFIPIVVGDYSNYFTSINPYMTRNRQVIDIPPVTETPLLMEIFNEPFWDFLNVRYYISHDYISLPEEKWEIVYDDEMIIYENSGWLPRWFCVADVWATESVDETFSHSRNIDPSELAIVHADVVAEISRVPDPPGYVPPEPGTVEMIRYSSDEVVLEVETIDWTFLVFSDTYYPGWKVWIDNELKEVARTNGIIKGVWVPPGTHTVRFLYDPITWKIGWLLAIIGLVLIPVTIKHVQRLLG